MKTEYLLFNVIILTLSTVGCFLYTPRRWPHVKSALVSILFISGFFVIVDYFVTGVWWGFNESYILGIKVGTLPIEEILFFLVIPWSCLVIWENLKYRVRGSITYNIEAITIAVGSAIAVIGFNSQWWYTVYIALALIIIGIASLYSKYWLRRKASLVFMGLVFICTLVFNGYLTARPIVMYNPDFMSNLLVGTIPIEDIVYGLSLMSGIAMLYERRQK